MAAIASETTSTLGAALLSRILDSGDVNVARREQERLAQEREVVSAQTAAADPVFERTATSSAPYDDTEAAPATESRRPPDPARRSLPAWLMPFAAAGVVGLGIGLGAALWGGTTPADPKGVPDQPVEPAVGTAAVPAAETAAAPQRADSKASGRSSLRGASARARARHSEAGRQAANCGQAAPGEEVGQRRADPALNQRSA